MHTKPKIKLFSLAILVTVCSFAWAGEDAWKTKPYQQWDEKDIRQVLEDSPWVEVKTVSAVWRNSAHSATTQSGGQSGDKLASLGPPSGACDPSTRGGACDEDPHAAMGDSSRPVGEESSVETSQAGIRGPGTAAFLIRWNSAQTIREALARNALLHNRMTESEASNFVGQSPPAYEILFSGSDMSPFATMNEQELKSDVYLEARQSKQKVSPADVSIRRTPDNRRVILILFSFPHQTAEGQPLITSKDKEAEFVCKLKNLNLKADFDLHKMRSAKGLDL